MICVKCENEIPRGAEMWREVTGWEQRRTQGGTNHIAKRVPTGKFMCSPCMHIERAPQILGQTTIDEMLK